METIVNKIPDRDEGGFVTGLFLGLFMLIVIVAFFVGYARSAFLKYGTSSNPGIGAEEVRR